jgi:hypothetical protein
MTPHKDAMIATWLQTAGNQSRYQQLLNLRQVKVAAQMLKEFSV